MSTRQIHVFISHSWSHSGHYDTLAGWISNKAYSIGSASLDFRDYSIPRSDPIHNANSTAELHSAIIDQVARSHVVVLTTGMYNRYSEWIKAEVEGAKQYNKSILAVQPWAQKKHAGFVLDAADAECGWNQDSVVSTIWELYKEQKGI